MPFDYKKEYKEFYLPPKKPQLVEVPPMNYVAVRGHGDPNAQDGEYQAAIGMLYAVAFTIKMSYKGSTRSPAILNMWCRRWRAFGGRRGKAGWITPIRKHSPGSP